MSRTEKVSKQLDSGIIVTLELSGKENVRQELEVTRGSITSPLSLNLHITEIMDALDEAIEKFRAEDELRVYVPLTTYTRTVSGNMVFHFIK